MPLDENELRQRARARLQSTQLPTSPPIRVWLGRGTGHPCALCDEPITTGEVEHELEVLEGVTLRIVRFHARCHAVWDSERPPD